MKKLLLVEDEINLLETIKLNLEIEGYQVEGLTNGKQALVRLKNDFFDGAILDVMLPEIDGFTICENIRTLDIKTPILFLSAKLDSESRIKGLKVGGNDYLTKPFELEELLLRVKLLTQKQDATKHSSPAVINLNGWTVDLQNFSAIKNNSSVSLSKKEIEMLGLLYNNKNRVVSRDEILEKVWKNDPIPTPRTIDNFILQLRKIFETDPKNPTLIQSVRGVGYKLVI